MDLEIRDKLVTALESGNYKKGRHVLRNTYNEYCCLGVLCDMYQKEIGGQWIKSTNTSEYRFIDSGENKSIFYLPTDVSKWAGIECEPRVDNPCYENKLGEKIFLSALNDNSDSFAPVIEILKSIK